ncbi:ERF family protein [Clostridium sp. Mt-5]|uniref:ERF family protein n=1 Tax=Clostridium moutaii TaxID=3240932 RepID=A0ABV4BU48_9CLOT
METSEEIKNISTAMIAIEKEIQGMTPDANNPFFKSSYITLDGILEYIRPILAKNNVWLFQNAFGDGEYICVVTRLNHSSGEFIETDVLKMKPQKNDPQQLGSCITYAKRYQLASLLGISSEIDDDGNRATRDNSNQNNNNQNKTTNTNNNSNRKFKCEKCGSNIAENVAQYSKSKFGHLLCRDCQKNMR